MFLEGKHAILVDLGLKAALADGFGYDIHGPAESVRKPLAKFLNPGRVVKSGGHPLMVEFEGKIDVGLRGVFAARGGAEQRQALDAELPEFGLVLPQTCDDRVSVHGDNIAPLLRLANGT